MIYRQDPDPPRFGLVGCYGETPIAHAGILLSRPSTLQAHVAAHRRVPDGFPSAKEWVSFVSALLADATEITVDAEETTTGFRIELLEDLLHRLGRADDLEDLLREHPCVVELDGHTYVRSVPVGRELERLGVRLHARDVCDLLRAAGFERVKKPIDNKDRRVWRRRAARMQREGQVELGCEGTEDEQ